MGLFNGDDSKPLRFWEIVAMAAYFIGLAAIGTIAGAEGSLRLFGILWIVGTGAWLLGSTLGFLFGVPKVRTDQVAAQPAAAPTPSQRADGTPIPRTAIVPNTNLEQISDWLTKIIIGATLVQLDTLALKVSELSKAIGTELGMQAGGSAVSGAVLICFFSAGFLWGYLWCSLRIFREMEDLVERAKVVQEREDAVEIKESRT